MAKNIKCSLNIYISLFDASRCQTHTYILIFLFYTNKKLQNQCNQWLKLIEDEKIYIIFNKTPMMCTCINRLTYTQHEISIK